MSWVRLVWSEGGTPLHEPQAAGGTVRRRAAGARRADHGRQPPLGTAAGARQSQRGSQVRAEHVEDVVADRLARPGATWQVHTAGTLDVLPDTTARALKKAVEATRECATGAHVTLAIGYGGRQEVLDAIRALLYEQADSGGTLTGLAQTLTTDDIARHLYTAGQPDPDLVIRTSGEQRVSGFLLWQTVHSEMYFCDAFWPAFREIDFLRALRSCAARQNRREA
jgi:short-chain Z-isoprenyl diphosphate synthase